jgi:hypothetical protein
VWSCPLVSSHFSPGAAPQVGHRIPSIFLGLSFFIIRTITPPDFRCLLVDSEPKITFCAVAVNERTVVRSSCLEPNAVGKFL